MDDLLFQLLTGFLMASAAAIVTLSKRALTVPAAGLACVFALLICGMSGWRQSAFLIGMYAVVFTANLIFRKQNVATGKGTVKRGFSQILANGGPAVLLIVLFYFTKTEAFLFGYYASIFEVMADSIASDVGVFSRTPPRDICTWKKLPTGMSGGISVLGCISSLVCVVGITLAAGATNQWNIIQILVVLFASYGGMLLDSVLGSRLQLRLRCNICGKQTEHRIHCRCKTVYDGGLFFMTNSVVNTLCTAAAGLAAVVLLM